VPLSTFSFRRPVTSYAKVQAGLGRLLRNRPFQLRRPRAQQSRYLDLGCGLNTHDDFINLDYLWHPKIDVCWDISRGLPFGAGSMQGVFSEHCFEHFPLTAVHDLLREIRRVLSPDGMVRIVVPDAELYLRTYVRQLEGDFSRAFPYQIQEVGDKLWTPLASINRVFYQDRESLFGHRTMFDFKLLNQLLLAHGFDRVSRCEFRQGRDARLLIDTPDRRVESLYVEASRAFGNPS
jgi:predicted SAM-dependent methyltransferase